MHHRLWRLFSLVHSGDIVQLKHPRRYFAVHNDSVR
jgi:hypothetical protein